MRDKFPPQGARPRDNIPTKTINRTLADAKETFLSGQLVKNNQQDEDPGVKAVLDALTKDNPEKDIKSDRNIKKDQLLAAVAFLKLIPLSETKETFKENKVDQLIEGILNKYNCILPDICN